MMLGHLTGRLLLRRESYKVDAGKVIDAAIANKVIIALIKGDDHGQSDDDEEEEGAIE